MQAVALAALLGWLTLAQEAGAGPAWVRTSAAHRQEDAMSSWGWALGALGGGVARLWGRLAWA